MAERAVSGGIVGPTFACLLGEQFALFKTGDRFVYENDFHPTGFTKGLYQFDWLAQVHVIPIKND